MLYSIINFFAVMYFMFTDTVSTGENQRTKHGVYAPLEPSMKSTDRLKLYRTECARHDIGISWQMYSTRQPVFGAIQQPFSGIHTRLEPTTMPTTQQSIYRCVCRYPLITNERTNDLDTDCDCKWREVQWSSTSWMHVALRIAQI